MGRSRDIAKFLSATEADNTDNLNLLHTGSNVGVDSAQAQRIGLQTYSTLDSLPMTDLEQGEQAFITGTNRLYISNGAGWYNIALINRNPRWDSGGEPDASYDIADSATPLVVIAKAVDSDNSDINLLNQSIVTDSAQYMVNITNDSSVFTFTPKSADSIGIEVAAGNLTDSNGDFVYTFKWSDGINFVSKAVTIGYSPAGGGAPAEGTFYGNRGIYMSGGNGQYYTDIDYWDMTTAGNASKFGDMSPGYVTYSGAASSNTRAVLMGGTGDGTAFSDTYAGYGLDEIFYITCATLGNSSSFGSLPRRTGAPAVEGDGTYAVCAGGGTLASSNQASTDVDVANMEYVTIASTSNSTTRGNLTLARAYAAAASNGTTMVIGGGYYSQHSSAPGGLQYNYYDRIDYHVVANYTNCSDFGNLISSKVFLAAAGTGGGDRALFMGGQDTGAPSNGSSYIAGTASERIEYITVSSPGNATDFGDLRGGFAGGTPSGDGFTSACANGTKAHFCGGRSGRTGSNAAIDEIQEVTMDTPGNAILFGALTYARFGGNATSGGSA